jgi:hypothetical protein
MRNANGQRGVIALVTVVFIGLLVLSVGITAAFVGQTATITAGQLDTRTRVLAAVAACFDEGAYRLKGNPSYTGGTIPIGTQDTCTIAISGSGATRTMTATASSGIFTKTVTLTATRKQNAGATATGWAFGAWTEVDP